MRYLAWYSTWYSHRYWSAEVEQHQKTKIAFSGILSAFLHVVKFNIIHMTDIDYIRLSAMMFAMQLIGKVSDPVSEGIEMAERLFNRLNEKDV